MLGSNILLWSLAGTLVWQDAAHDLSELLDKIANNSYSHDALLHERQELLHDLLWSLIWPLVIGLPILAAIVTMVIYWANRSLSHLSTTLATRKPLTFTAVPASDLPRELLPVVDELNHLFARMQSSVEKEQRFTADAAHELRTPIAAMRAQAQVARMCTDEHDRQHALTELMVSCDRASHLVAQLLVLARLEGSVQGLPAEKTFDLTKLLRNVMAWMATDAQAKQQHLSLEQDSDRPEIMVRADETLMGILLRNLLDNTVRYSPMGAEISVTLTDHAGVQGVLIEDSGKGMSEAEIARLGERFFRSQANDSIGSGLGWSIVRQISVAQNLRIEVGQSKRLGGLSVFIQMGK